MNRFHIMLKSIAILLLLAVSTFAQTVLTTGDVEFSVNFRGSLVGTGTNPWLLTLRDGAALDEYAGVRTGFADPERVLLRGDESTRLEVPDDPRYSFLGIAGAFVWILPEASEDDLLTPGISTENRTAQTGWQGFGVSSNFLVQGVSSGVFLSNQITLTLASFSGPGNFFLFRTNGFGDPLLSFRTDDGLNSGDSLLFNSVTHGHYNWAFTAPGDYYLGIRASGTLTGNQFTQSDVTTFRIHIVPEPSASLLMLGSLSLLGNRRLRRISRDIAPNC